jgi:hypothetical protein
MAKRALSRAAASFASSLALGAWRHGARGRGRSSAQRSGGAGGGRLGESAFVLRAGRERLDGSGREPLGRSRGVRCPRLADLGPGAVLARPLGAREVRRIGADDREAVRRGSRRLLCSASAAADLDEEELHRAGESAAVGDRVADAEMTSAAMISETSSRTPIASAAVWPVSEPSCGRRSDIARNVGGRRRRRERRATQLRSGRRSRPRVGPVPPRGLSRRPRRRSSARPRARPRGAPAGPGSGRPRATPARRRSRRRRAARTPRRRRAGCATTA